MYLMGIDVGTTSCKVLVFDTGGTVIANASREYPLLFPRDTWMELDPRTVAESVFACIRACTEQCDGEKIKALAVSTQGEAVVPVGRKGEVLANSITTFDARSKAEAGWLEEQLGKEGLMRITGAPVHSMFTLPKLLWIRSHQPEVFAATWKFMCFGDYISYLLGAEACIDFSMASRTMMFDIADQDWSAEIMQLCGLDHTRFSLPVASGTVIGKINTDVAKRLGLSPDAQIVAGGHDQSCCAIGSGVLRSGLAMDSLGTTESILCVRDQAIISQEMIDNNLPCYIFPLDGLYAYLSFLSSSGSILKWFRDRILRSEDPDVYKAMDDEADLRFSGPSGVFVLPHFAGSGSPYLDANSKGIISGLSLNTDLAQLYKGIIEGTCYEARLNIEVMDQSGIHFDELRCIGGGANSPLWLQVKADITNKRVLAMETNETGCLGAALLAGLGIGLFTDIESVIKDFVHVKREYSPSEEMHAAYSKQFAKYSEIYRNNKTMFETNNGGVF